MAQVSDLVGLTLTNAEKQGDGVVWFKAADGRQFTLHHAQDCCESVVIESIVGDLSDLVGEPILLAELVTHENEHPDGATPPKDYDTSSYTWTFYKFATRKGYVDIRWFGSSNGYYSERVDFDEFVAR